MRAAQWEEVKSLFCLALTTSTDYRSEFLSSACSCDAVRIEVMRLLEQHNSAGDFLVEPAWADLSAIPLQSEGGDTHFAGTSRFVIQEKLGEGTFGIVYRALDRERNSMVALKTLRQLDAGHLSRFKHEFRSLVDLVHPNLVQLYELFGDDKVWFFTMELVEGIDFLSYTRPRDVIASWDRIRETLAQLTSGVQALHSAERLHRDLKPTNVLVSNTGQVLILDFGLVKELEGTSSEQSIALAGSPAYMAPEQVGGRLISAAVDWYAVGVMLFRVITGVLPFEGDWQEVLSRKQAEDAPNPRTLNPDVPKDLGDICHELLRRTPELRADGRSILSRLQRRAVSQPLKSQDPFVGRLGELDLLRERFQALNSGDRQVVLIQGQSGIGKTTLVGEFLGRVASQHPGTMILRGRCRESESVPYKALDAAADQLVRYLRAMPEASAAALLPRHPALLTRIFPCFRELETLSPFSERTNDLPDDHEIRRRAFAAVCEMLGRITDRQRLIISIDDLQWGDLDSIALLTELIVPEHAPSLMLILTFRSEDAASSPPVRLLRTFRGRIADLKCWTEIDLAGLTDEDGIDLLQRLTGNVKLRDEQLQEMVEESRGSPLFLRELLRFTLQDEQLNESGPSTFCVGVTEMVVRRTNVLSPIARQLFEALSVAVEPLSKAMLCRAVKATDADLSREISLLVRENLVRITGGLEAGRFETYHDQIREALLASLSPSELKNWHKRLAQALEAEKTVDPQRLLRHHLGADDTAAAYQAALAAAEIAEKALAFDREASFYTAAIGTGEADAKSLAMLHRQRAEALAKAGRGREAADEYLTAALWPEYSDPFQMRRLAAEQLMRSGYLDEGVTAFSGLLRSAGFWMPRTPLQSIIAMLALRTFIRLRGMRWRRRQESDLSYVTLRNLDLLWSGASVFLIVNPVFGTYLQARHMLGALRAGEPLRLALSVGLGAPFEALGGAPYYLDGRRFLDLAEKIASDLNNSHLFCSISVDWIFFDFLCSRIKDGLEHARSAIQILSELGIGQTWEGGTAKLGLIWFLSWGGRIQEMSALLPSILDEARSRGDTYTYVIVRCGAPTHLVELAADDPDGALEKISQALAQWSQVRYDSPHFGAAYASVECELYAGRIDQARKRLLTEWPALKRSLMFRKCQTFRIMLFYMRARTALATWTLRRDDHILILEIEFYLSLLKNARSPWGTALGEAIESSIEAGRGHVSQAILLLESAEALLSQQGFRLQAAAISRRRGELEGEEGCFRVQAADAFMRSEGIIRPDRMTYMILPA